MCLFFTLLFNNFWVYFLICLGSSEYKGRLASDLQLCKLHSTVAQFYRHWTVIPIPLASTMVEVIRLMSFPHFENTTINVIQGTSLCEL